MRAVIALLASTLAASAAHAAPWLTVSSTATATSLILDGEGSTTTHITKVADLSLSTDGARGFTLTISSGSLAKGNAAPLPFQVALVDAGAAAPAAASFTVAAGASLSYSTSAPGLVQKDLYIKYTPARLQDPGAYAASILATISDR